MLTIFLCSAFFVNDVFGDIVRYNTPFKKMEQRIHYDNDVIKLLDSIAWIHLHGYGNDYKLSHKQKIEIAKTAKLTLSCGHVVQFVMHILNDLDYEVRFVSIETRQKRNGYDDCHGCLEIVINGKWILFDLTGRVYFEKYGQMLSAEEVIKYGVMNVAIVSYSAAPKLNYGQMVGAEGYDYTFYCEEKLLRHPSEWYKRIFQSCSYPYIEF